MAGGVSAAPPTLWLRCGTCAGSPNLATVTSAVLPRIAGSPALPGEGIVVQQRRDGRWSAYPRRGKADEFTHQFWCKVCGASYKVGQERLARWWAEFAASDRNRDVVYLGRHR